ncbi:thioredoxin domain-containing protein [Gleimia sp. 6138-11-ORH1]|uniref:thioredoxin domain-containing protein n=1 Tax=Gleimia sp. 6138-11-ORH1 TaxID=2973937 RepID=UPI0021679A61|nr:thioredoxin domain-containing protein [Gleimia sp. 6138-11-ORH1]MCS4484779.1 thioredoxin domain-containing protein [Gleimia sp. 6138-11-ORH1]
MAKKSDATRLKAEQLRAAQAKQDAKTRNILIAVVSTLVALTVVLSVWVIWNSKGKEGATPAPTEVTAFAVSADGVGKLREGVPTVTEYFDYSCHACADVDGFIGAQINEAVAAGKYNIRFVPVTVVGMSWHYAATNAAALTYAESPENFVKFHNSLLSFFKTQFDSKNVSIIQNDQASLAKVKELAKEAGVPDEVIEKFDAKASTGLLETNRNFWQSNVPEGRENLGTPEFQADNKVIKLSGATVEELYSNFENAFLTK